MPRSAAIAAAAAWGRHRLTQLIGARDLANAVSGPRVALGPPAPHPPRRLRGRPPRPEQPRPLDGRRPRRAAPGAALSHRAGRRALAAAHSPAAATSTSPSPAGRSRRAPGPAHPPLPPAQSTRSTIRDRIAVTTPARTLARPPPRRRRRDVYRRALRQAEFKRHGPRRRSETDGTRSEPERDFLRLCRRHRLPAPEVNVRDRPLHRRLPLAPRTPRRRGRRLAAHRGRAGVRGRPRARPRPAHARLPGPAASPAQQIDARAPGRRGRRSACGLSSEL